MTLCSFLDTKKESAAEKLGKWLVVGAIVVSAVFAVVELTFLSRTTRTEIRNVIVFLERLDLAGL